MRIFTTATAAHSPIFPTSRHRIASMQPVRLHVEWIACMAADTLRHADMLKLYCMRICEEHQLNVLGNAFFQFEPSGVAGTILLPDSHIALQTWPDQQKLTAELAFECPKNDAVLLLEQLALHILPDTALKNFL